MAKFTYRSILVTVGLAILLPPTQGFAQSRGSSLIEEVVVTARKREESLQDAPLAVTALTAEQLDFRGLSDIENLDQFTPNLVLKTSPTYSNVTNAAAYIRGIGQNDFTPAIDPGVGMYVDGVYLGRSVGAILNLVDLERIEVLRGPQGTLFGRNTIGGAIVLYSKKPNEEFGGKVDLKYGKDNRINVRGTVNVPLTDNLFSRFSVASFSQDGYVKRVSDGTDFGDDDTIAARIGLRWLPNDNLDINFAADYSRDRENGSPALLTGYQPISLGLAAGGGPSQHTAANTIAAQLATGGPASFVGGEFFDVTHPSGFPFQALACEAPSNTNNPLCANSSFFDDGSKNKNFGTDPTFAELDVWGASLTIDWEINDTLAVKSISAWREFDGHFEGDQDGTPVRVSYLIDIYEHEQFSQELQLLGTSFDDRLDWIIGGYFFNEQGKNINPVRFSQVNIQSGGHYENEAWAVFGQGNWHINDQLDLTLGLRYTEDSKDYLPDQFFEAFPIGPLPFTCPAGLPAPPAAVCGVGDRVLPFETVTRETTEFVPMVNLSYRWNEGLMTYLMYSEGFKSGGYTQRIFPPEPSLPGFEPEFVKSYEVGLKYDGWDNRLRFNLAFFFTDYTDVQLLTTDPSRLGPFVTNAGDAEVTGLEMETVVNPAEGWYISGSVGMQDPEWTSLNDTVVGLTLDSRFQFVSKWTTNVQIYKEIPIGNWGFLTPRLEWSYRTKWGTNTAGLPRENGATEAVNVGPLAGVPLSFGVANPNLLNDELHLLNASVRWDVKDTGLSLNAGIDNITHEQYQVFGNYQDAFGFTQQTFHRGREWYISGSLEF